MDKQLQYLRNEITDMDSLIQEHGHHIDAIAELAEAWLSTPKGWKNPDPAFRALRLIRYLTDIHVNLIGLTTEKLGCGHTDEEVMRLYLARKGGLHG